MSKNRKSFLHKVSLCSRPQYFYFKHFACNCEKVTFRYQQAGGKLSEGQRSSNSSYVLSLCGFASALKPMAARSYSQKLLQQKIWCRPHQFGAWLAQVSQWAFPGFLLLHGCLPPLPPHFIWNPLICPPKNSRSIIHICIILLVI